MGLDIVELVMEVEEAFDITIRDQDAERLRTVGDLYDYVLAQLADGEVAQPLPCLGAAGFYPLRRALMASAGVDRAAVILEAPIGVLLPKDGRRSRWVALERSLGLSLPDLECPTWIVWGAAVLYSVPPIIMAASWWNGSGTDPGLVLLAIVLWLSLVGPLALILGYVITRPLAREIPLSCRTVRGLAVVVACSNYARMARCGRGWNREEVWVVLRSTIARVLGVSPEVVTKDARIVEDLGAD